MIRYMERQYARRLAIGPIFLVLGLLGTAAGVRVLWTDKDMTLLLTFGLLLAYYWFARLEIKVEENALIVSVLGFRRRIELERIEDVQIQRIDPGIRFTNFLGVPWSLGLGSEEWFNFTGREAVVLRLVDDRLVRVGTQNPKRLAGALNRSPNPIDQVSIPSLSNNWHEP